MNRLYADYAVEKTVELLAIDSPTGYTKAAAEMEEMIDDLFNDEDLRLNVKNSAPSAYESAVSEKLSDRISAHLLDGVMTDNKEKTEYYTALSADSNIKKQIGNRIIRKIKDFLNLAS